ncbi:NAD(P)H-quinone oxidoreductase subunit K chloroplastic [Bienertia sinuspersici]
MKKYSTPSSKGPEKLSSYESGIEPMGHAWLQFRIRYYMFALFMPGEKEHWNGLNLQYSDNKKKKGKDNKIETVINSIEFPLLDRIAQNSVISTTSNDLSNWSRLSSLWPLLYGASCCFIEFASLIGLRFDFDRYGLVPRSSPRQADLILTAGTVTMKMAPSLVRLYEQMPEPKYVIAMGACTITGGCSVPILILRKKISREIHEDRIKSQQKNRCFTINHKFRVGRSIHNGNYDQGLLSKYKSPSTSEIPTETFFKYKSSAYSTEFGRFSAWLVKHGLVRRSLGFDYQGVETLQIKSEDWHSLSPGGLLASVYHLTRIIRYGSTRRDFQERESYDMLAITYDSHPRFKCILMPESWIVWPLRKDLLTLDLWPLLYGASCCFIEFTSLIGSRFKLDRYGLVPRPSPRQADLILTAGTVIMKMAPSLVRLYEQMPEPKYVIAMGACTITGGMFSTDSYSTVRVVDKIIHVDVYLSGFPPKPKAVIDAIMKLRKKISRERHEDRIKSQQKNKCFNFNHKFRVGRSIHTGNNDQGLLSKYKSPSTSEIPTETFFKYKSSASSTEFVN